MNAQEAYEKVCDYMNERAVVSIAREYRNHYGFFMAPPESEPGNIAFVGKSMFCVNKQTGRVFTEADPEYKQLIGTRWIRISITS